MSNTVFRVLPFAALLLALIGPAAAADLPEDDIIPAPQPEAVPLAPASSWYLRGDVAYSFTARGDGHYKGFNTDPSEFDYDEWKLRWRGDADLGLGYRFDDHFRADATVGYWERDVGGKASSPFHCLDSEPDSHSCSFDDDAKLRAWEVMANAYYDFFHYGRFTPYGGGGIGFARLKYSGLTNNATCVDENGADVADCGYTGHHSGRSSTRFAWALMAGTAVDLTERLKLDVGYRFSHFEGGDAFGWDEDDSAAGASGTQTYDHGFSVHQIRAGLRLGF